MAGRSATGAGEDPRLRCPVPCRLAVRGMGTPAAGASSRCTVEHEKYPGTRWHAGERGANGSAAI